MFSKQPERFLSESPMNMTELAKAMGYKGITQKQKRTVEKLESGKVLSRQAGEDNTIWFSVKAQR